MNAEVPGELPLVTVFVACYNHARFVVQALESVRAQDYRRVQLIVADDCSKDDSVAVIRGWLEQHWPDAHFIVHAKNRGICATFNEILDRANGKYISGFAADDVWLPGRLRAHVEFMERQPEQVGVIYGDVHQIDENGARLPLDFNAAHRNLSPLPEGWIFETVIAGNFIPAMSTLVRRRCFEIVGGYDETLAFEDWDMWLRISRQFEFRAWPQPTAQYRVLATSMMRTMSAELYRSGDRILLKCLEQGWLSGYRRLTTLNLEHRYAMQGYVQRTPGWFGAVWRCFCRHPGPKNFLLLACAVTRLPARWHSAGLRLGQRIRRALA